MTLRAAAFAATAILAITASTPAFAHSHERVSHSHHARNVSGGTIASFYDEPQRVACGGGRFNPNGLTAASRTLPCGTHVVVTNKANGKSVTVTINDRGPAAWTGRTIDLSRAAASRIGMIVAGTAHVSIQVAG